LSGTLQKGGINGRLAAIEYEIIVDSLKASDGNMTEVARDLGITRRILGLRMEKLGISYKDYRIVEKKNRSTQNQTAPASRRVSD
jgi:Nif-specific regulatory protein